MHSCVCLLGFKPKPAENGFEMEKPLSCSSIHISQVQKVKLPNTENTTAHSSVNLDACKILYLVNCSCVAYAVVIGPNSCRTAWRFVGPQKLYRWRRLSICSLRNGSMTLEGPPVDLKRLNYYSSETPLVN
ncbi:hypothetical protein ZIOFF_029127 [Zingiber officinale]|uniref:Apple domain-containing protein n=1 Tax=Zingiber officinale TaxID=94328 RepID=A0A8J5GX42_ZINOF|nr:hypothetical protein ZIOFF_029127 [Zingiber officinale]